MRDFSQEFCLLMEGLENPLQFEKKKKQVDDFLMTLEIALDGYVELIREAEMLKRRWEMRAKMLEAFRNTLREKKRRAYEERSENPGV